MQCGEGSLCGFGCVFHDIIRYFSRWMQRLLHIRASFHLKLSNFSFLPCLLFVHLLSELQIPKSERPAEEWQGKPQEKKTTTCHLTRSEIQRKMAA